MSPVPVRVYSKPGCQQCVATVRELTKLGIEHTYLDITEDPASYQRVVDLGYGGVPVVEAGDMHWHGFRPDRIKSLTTAADDITELDAAAAASLPPEENA